jgi:hypothetical protein
VPSLWTTTLQRPWHTFVLGGPSARPESTSIDFSMDALSARAQVKFAGDRRGNPSGFPAVDVNQHCWIQGGYRDASSAESNQLLFDGFIEDDGSSFDGSALANTISLGDRLRLAQYTLGDPFYDQAPFDTVAIYDGTQVAVLDASGAVVGTVPSPTNNAASQPGGVWTDTAIVRDLIVRSGVASSASDPVLSGIGGQNLIMANQQGIVLSNRQKPSDLITQIDQATGCKTFSTPVGPQRIATSFTPTTSAAWTLRQGIEILQIENVRSLKAFYNRVIVKGLRLGGAQWVSIRQAPANLPAVAGGAPLQLPYGRPSSQPITYAFGSDLIQSQDMADRLSNTLMIIGNRLERKISIKTRFNPDAVPGQTAAVYAPNAKIYSTTNGYVFGISHSFDSGGAFTTWTIAIYDGVSGVTIGSGPIVAILPAQVAGPFVDADTGSTYYSVSLDASNTHSTSYSSDQLAFAWSDAFGGSGSLPTYSFMVTTGQLGGASGSLVTLAVTDPAGQSSSATVTVSFL